MENKLRREREFDEFLFCALGIVNERLSHDHQPLAFCDLVCAPVNPDR